jgi:hypothetical protein
MRFAALATDYDGTLAHDGVVKPPTLEALRRLRDSGRKVLLVMGGDGTITHAGSGRTSRIGRWWKRRSELKMRLCLRRRAEPRSSAWLRIDIRCLGEAARDVVT